MLTRRPEALELTRAAGLGDELVDAVTTSASVYAAGVLHPLPAGTLMGVPFDAAAARSSGVLSLASVSAIETEPMLPALPPLVDDVGIGALVRERLGDEIVDRLVEPLLAGVYAGRADRISLRAALPALAARLHDRGFARCRSAGRRRGWRRALVRSGVRGDPRRGRTVAGGARRVRPVHGAHRRDRPLDPADPGRIRARVRAGAASGADRRRRGDRRHSAGQGGGRGAGGGPPRGRRARCDRDGERRHRHAGLLGRTPAAGQWPARGRPGTVGRQGRHAHVAEVARAAARPGRASSLDRPGRRDA